MLQYDFRPFPYYTCVVPPWLEFDSAALYILKLIECCSGLMKPDTRLGGHVTTMNEVFHGKTTRYIFN